MQINGVNGTESFTDSKLWQAVGIILALGMGIAIGYLLKTMQALNKVAKKIDEMDNVKRRGTS